MKVVGTKERRIREKQHNSLSRIYVQTDEKTEVHHGRKISFKSQCVPH